VWGGGEGAGGGEGVGWFVIRGVGYELVMCFFFWSGGGGGLLGESVMVRGVWGLIVGGGREGGG